VFTLEILLRIPVFTWQRDKETIGLRHQELNGAGPANPCKARRMSRAVFLAEKIYILCIEGREQTRESRNLLRSCLCLTIIHSVDLEIKAQKPQLAENHVSIPI
jgi:hypothetical protein